MNFLPLIAGSLFSIIGVGYFLGDKRGVPASMVGMLFFVVGFVFFLVQVKPLPFTDATPILLLAPLSGAIGTITLFLMDAALKKGMKYAMWIAVNITFLPQTIYCLVRFNEPVTLGQWVGMGLAIACIVVLAGGSGTPQSEGQGKFKTLLINIPLLLGLLLSNSMLLIFIKELSYFQIKSGSLWDAGSALFYTLLYGSMILMLLPMNLRSATKRALLRKAIPTAIIAGIGSVSGLSVVSLIVSSGLSAGRSFPVMSVATILLGSLMAVLFFKEKLTPTFFLGNGLAILSIAATLLF